MPLQFGKYGVPSSPSTRATGATGNGRATPAEERSLQVSEATPTLMTR
jgi:hypothetical protein